MQSIFVCNTAGDSLSEINLMNYNVNNYPLDLGKRPVGPQKITYYKDKLIISNSYNDTISIFSLKEKKEISNMYIGAHPNDLKIYGSSAYVVCSDSNSVVEADIDTGELISSLSVSEYPHSIEIDDENKILYVSSLNCNVISVVDLKNGIVIAEIKTYENPTKIFLSKDKKNLYLCESNFGRDIEGYISIISTENYKVTKRIRAGMEPIDLWVEDNKLYVVSLSEGSLNIIDIQKGRQIKKIYIGGMPKSIIKIENDIFIGDYMNGRVVKVNLKERVIKNITVGKEPNAMILVDYLL